MKEDWVDCALGDVVISEKGIKPPNLSPMKTIENPYPYVNIEAFEKDIISQYTDGVKCRFCYKEDFLMVWDGSRSGLVGKGVDGVLGSTLVRIYLPNIENNYGFYFLKSKYLEINTRAKGTGTPHVDPGLLWNYTFPLPPLPIQRAIVSRIEALFSSLDKGISELKTAQEQLKIYRQAVLKKAFEGELTREWREQQILSGVKLPTAEELLEQIKEERKKYYEKQLKDWESEVQQWETGGKKGTKPGKPKGIGYLKKVEPGIQKINHDIPQIWKIVKLGEIFQVYVGSTPSRKVQSYWDNGEINWVSSGEVAFNYIYKTKEKITKLGLNNCSTIVHPIGTVMLAMIGEGKTRGQAAILKIEACHNQNTAAIRVTDINFNSEFLFYYFFLRYQRNRNIGSGNNQKALNQERVLNFEIPLCSLPEQNQIVLEIEKRLSVCDKMEETIKISLEKANALRQSILKKAFDGKLLTEEEIEACKREADYEPASVLLGRIQEEKEKNR